MNSGADQPPGKPLRAAFGLLTRAPVGPMDDRPGTLGTAVAYFPLVGLALGIVAALAGAVLIRLLPPWPVAVAVVALTALATGGLHLDGLADTADGLGASRGDRERALQIMRDSRMGSFGGAALVTVLVGKISAIAGLYAIAPGETAFWAVALSPVAGRWGAVAMIRGFPYARIDGLGRRFREGSGVRELVVATTTALLCALVAAHGSFAAMLSGGAAALAVGWWISRHLGGLTGDVYGAGVEIGELMFLWAYLAQH
jgi:adenosylcobinamide-GDP ribazoletransferase